MAIDMVNGSGKNEEHIIFGDQLRKARETVQLLPKEVAGQLGIDREEILDWENERAKPNLHQLELLAQLYGREIDYFLKETPSAPLQIQFRSVTERSFTELSLEARKVIGAFDELCRTAFELERVLGKIRPPEIAHVPKSQSPVDLARDQRKMLGFYEKPISNLRDRLMDRGGRIFELDVPAGQFSGFSYWHRDYGPCILININDLLGRKNFTLAHEYAHLLYDHAPSVCDISEEAGPTSTGDERLADVFAVEFLLPLELVHDDFSMRGLTQRPSIQEVGRMAGRWRVSVQAMFYRLEDLRLVERGYARELLASYRPPHPRTPRGPRLVRRMYKRVGKPFVSNSIEAYRDGHISLGKLAHSLGLPIRTALEVAERHSERY